MFRLSYGSCGVWIELVESVESFYGFHVGYGTEEVKKIIGCQLTYIDGVLGE